MLLAAWGADALDESHGCCFVLLLEIEEER
jgi:hypothetical protein